MPTLSRSAAGCPSRGSWQKLGGFDADASDWQEREMEEKGDSLDESIDPATGFFNLLPSMSLKFQPFQNRLPSKPVDRVAAPP